MWCDVDLEIGIEKIVQGSNRMFTVILFLFAGIAAGRLLRNRDCGWVSKLTTILIWSLLFLLGVEVGGNRTIISSLPSLGLDALLIAVLSLAGSCLFAWLLWRHLKSEKKGS